MVSCPGQLIEGWLNSTPCCTTYSLVPGGKQGWRRPLLVGPLLSSRFSAILVSTQRCGGYCWSCPASWWFTVCTSEAGVSARFPLLTGTVRRCQRCCAVGLKFNHQIYGLPCDIWKTLLQQLSNGRGVIAVFRSDGKCTCRRGSFFRRLPAIITPWVAIVSYLRGSRTRPLGHPETARELRLSFIMLKFSVQFLMLRTLPPPLLVVQHGDYSISYVPADCSMIAGEFKADSIEHWGARSTKVSLQRRVVLFFFLRRVLKSHPLDAFVWFEPRHTSM